MELYHEDSASLYYCDVEQHWSKLEGNYLLQDIWIPAVSTTGTKELAHIQLHAPRMYFFFGFFFFLLSLLRCSW